jgi:hypothetical protein
MRSFPEHCEREDERGKAIDAKITSVLAGVIAFIGFSIRAQSSLWTAVETLVYLVPLGVLLNAFRTERRVRAPEPESLHDGS